MAKVFTKAGKMTGKQKAFADKILANPTQPAYKAAQEVYNPKTDRTANSIAVENLQKPVIMAYLHAHSKEAEKTITEVMQYSKVQGMDNPAFAGVAVRAAQDVLDRVHGKATQKIEANTKTVSINIDLTGLATTDTDAS